MIDLPNALRHGRLSPAWVAVLAGVSLTVIGIMAIGTAEPGLVNAQIRWLVIALTACVLAVLVHPRVIHAGITLGALAFLALLVLLVTPGVPRFLVPTINGARRAINLGVMNFQPTEIAKIFYVLVMARYLRYRENYRSFLGLAPPFVITFIPIALVLMQPDLGTAILFGPALFFMLVAAGARMRHMWGLVGAGLLAVILAVSALLVLPESMHDYVMRPHQRQRILGMVAMLQGDTSKNQSSNFQQDRAMTLVGAGQMSGYGGERSATIVRLNALPEAHNDMVFAVVVNRWGFIGGISVIGLYGALFLSLIFTAALQKEPLPRLAIVGFTGFLFAQVSINVGMTIGLLPITGIALPFVSYGGTSLLASYTMLGITLNFACRKPAYLVRPSFEFDAAEAAA